MGKKRKKNQIQNKNYVDPEKRVVSEPIEMTQEFCYFDFDSPWEQMKKKKDSSSFTMDCIVQSTVKDEAVLVIV